MYTRKTIFSLAALLVGVSFLLTLGCGSLNSLGRGINMGDFLEAPIYEGSWSHGRPILETDFTVIKAAGFKSVRIPIRWSDHTDPDDPDVIDPMFKDRVKEVVDWALDAGLLVVINTHHYMEMFDPEDFEPLSYHRKRLKAIWAQICDLFPVNARYTKKKLVFELMNEPNKRIGYSEWNEIVAELTDVIWKHKAQGSRKIMIGPADWNKISALSELSLPAACNPDNTIITVHCYDPGEFTHQGAEWKKERKGKVGIPWRGTIEDQKPLLDLLDSVVAWNKDKNYEINLGEFGVYIKHADPEYQKAWIAFMVREAEKRGWSWTYWEFCNKFGAYDPETETWRPTIDALIPPKVRP